MVLLLLFANREADKEKSVFKMSVFVWGSIGGNVSHISFILAFDFFAVTFMKKKVLSKQYRFTAKQLINEPVIIRDE